MILTSDRIHVVELPSLPPISLNDREHYMDKARRIAEWREQSAWCAKAAQLPKVDKAHVMLVAYPPDRRRRDVDNLAPTWKAAVDGCRDAGVFEDDDSSRVSMAVKIAEPHSGGGWRWQLRIAEVDG